ncbi:MAG: hypothetical protein AAFQ39_13620 [Pseudomonadota bacterium]
MAQDNDTRMLLLIGLGALWVLAYGYSFSVFALTEPAGDGFVRGMNRVRAFFGWQGVAGMLADCDLGFGAAVAQGQPSATVQRDPDWAGACPDGRDGWSDRVGAVRRGVK